MTWLHNEGDISLHYQENIDILLIIIHSSIINIQGCPIDSIDKRRLCYWING